MNGCWTAFRDWGTLRVELGVGDVANASIALWGTAKWNAATSVWSGQEPTWNDVTERCMSVSVERGRRRWTERIGASSCTVTVDNDDGWIDWDTNAVGQTEVRPGTPIRVRAATTDGKTHDLWRGWIENIDDTYQPYVNPVASLTCQDGMAQISHVDLPERTPEGAGERSDQRVTRILDNSDWPTQWRVLETGQVTMQATNLARQMSDELGITADSEGGIVYSGTDGNVYLRNRDWLRLAAYATTVQATIGDGGTVCGSEYRVVRSADDIRNDVQLARAGGTVQRVVDQDSISLYRRRTYGRNDLICETDAQVILLAQRLLGSRAQATTRLTDVTIPVVDQPSMDFVTSVDYGWRLVVNWSDTSGHAWSRTVHVMGVQHSITPNEWVTSIAVDDATASPTEPWGVGKWGTAKWTEAS
jgi:hypothetical protein